ncbi:MAG: hypothetical protein OHK0041_20320 [Anaerolineales bacterium]
MALEGVYFAVGSHGDVDEYEWAVHSLIVRFFRPDWIFPAQHQQSLSIRLYLQ